MVKQSIIFVCFLVVTFVAITQALCPKCLCPIGYKPLCALQEKTGRLRGFNSDCVLNCSNQCYRNKYTFLGYGRCGAWKKKIEEERNRPRTTTKPPVYTTTIRTPETTKNFNSIPGPQLV